ncbi:3621_t:CDS:1 [Ambispora leptoticha]|uniref:Histone H2A n=1 Tax=Ambispora leptoticha TaxID=144679 RepID=A0A9N9FEP4_9GLOM|nr:3621_t:CDS:1 [Ambispora leptoticha]
MASKKKCTDNRKEKTGLIFPIGRIHRLLAVGSRQPSLFNDRLKIHVQANTPIYVAAVIEYLINEILVLSGNRAQSEKRSRIIPLDILSVIQNDDELKNLFSSLLPSLVQDLLEEDKEDVEVVESESEGNDTADKTIKLESLVLSEGNNIAADETRKLEYLVLSEGNNIAADETRKLESLVGMKNEGISGINSHLS